MALFESYFSISTITETLVGFRLKRAKLLHDKHFFKNLGTVKEKQLSSEINGLFPARRSWNRFRPKQRRGQEVDRITLLNAVEWHQKNEPLTPWLVRLREVCQRVKENALNSTFCFNSPEIVPLLKSGSQYRAISVFTRLDDRLMDIHNAKYLRDTLDISLEESCVAFRAAANSRLDRDHAIEGIISFSEQYPEENIVVAECDIRGFFDCISHQSAKQSLKECQRIATSRAPKTCLDPRSIAYFDSYLRCYTFPREVLRGAEQKLKKSTDNQDAHFKWPTSKTVEGPHSLNYFFKKPRQAKIGIPQGGAHSCLIANLALNFVDRETVLAMAGTNEPFRYYRYCDDMMILATKKYVANKGFDRYTRALENQKLPFHKPYLPPRHCKEFFTESKTKSPYCWGDPKQDPDYFPWIQFLGYQIRYDRLIRVRPSSFSKHRKKIKDFTGNIHKHVKKSSRRISARRVHYRANCKLAAFSVGKIQLNTDSRGRIMPMSWCSGFRKLKRGRVHTIQLRALDREIGKSRAYLRRTLRKLPPGRKRELSELTQKEHAFFGKRFSHVDQFTFEP